MNNYTDKHTESCFNEQKNLTENNQFNYADNEGISNSQLYETTENKSYITISSCILDHILTATNLTSCEKLYYIIADSLAIINKNQKNNRSCALSSKNWAKILGCSRSLIFTIQKNMVKKGYFIINKSYNKLGLNKKNIITPVIPEHVFYYLNEKYPNKTGEHLPYDHLNECKMTYFDRTKLFIRINHFLLKKLISTKLLNKTQKIIWLGFYMRSYKNYMLKRHYLQKKNSDFSFVTSYKELNTFFSFGYQNISKSIKNLEKFGFIKAFNFYIKKNDDIEHCTQNNNNIIDYDLAQRQDKSLWRITVSLPDSHILELIKIKNRANIKVKKIVDNTTDFSLIQEIEFNKIRLQIVTLQKELNSLFEKVNTVINLTNSSACNEVNNTSSNKISIIEDQYSNLNQDDYIQDLDKIDNPTFSKSRQYINKYFKIKNIISNLCNKQEVSSNNLVTKRKNNLNSIAINSKAEKNIKQKDFNIVTELIKNKLRLIPKIKANKARYFAYTLINKKLTRGYAASLTKNELAKELIYHAATWKPTHFGKLSEDKTIDIALSVAWKAITEGKWQTPSKLAKAKLLNYEYYYYNQKYQESGILSQEIRNLELEVNAILGSYFNLEQNIIKAKSKEGNYCLNNIEENTTNYSKNIKDEFLTVEILGSNASNVNLNSESNRKTIPIKNDRIVKIDKLVKNLLKNIGI